MLFGILSDVLKNVLGKKRDERLFATMLLTMRIPGVTGDDRWNVVPVGCETGLWPKAAS